jgi:hypothetical protein
MCRIRTGFVSNSSSSSFLVTNAKDGYETPDWEGVLNAGYDLGETCFGWGPERIDDIGSRVNFAYLQFIYGNNDDWFLMLDEVIKENTNIEYVNWLPLYEQHTKWNAYIDHQSNAGDGMNTEIFESKQTLKDFIFGKGSFIYLDNDNR